MNITRVIEEYIDNTRPLSFLVFKREKPLVIIQPSGKEIKSNYILIYNDLGYIEWYYQIHLLLL